jgi:hypothetical protein
LLTTDGLSTELLKHVRNRIRIELGAPCENGETCLLTPEDVVKISIGIMTACWIAAAPLGASADPGYATVTSQANASTASPVPPVTAAPSFRDRVRAAFGLRPLTKSNQVMQSANVAQPAATGQTSAITRAGYSVYAPVTTPFTSPQLSPEAGERPTTTYVAVHQPKEMVGHENDYSWISGQLYYVHANGGMWVIRYADVDQVDRYGGSVVLTPTVEMRNFREGDLVTVCGEILNDGIRGRTLGGALYRVNSIQMIGRNDRQQ